MSYRHLLLLPALLLAAAGAGELRGQNVILDEGTFSLYLDGEEAGSETFAIRRQGTGAEASLLANATIVLRTSDGTVRMRPYLKAGPDRAPLLYESALEGTEVSMVMVSSTGRHFVARIRSEAGERERELRARDGSVFLDREVAHHHYFLGGLAERPGARIPTVEPRTGAQSELTVESVTSETIRIGGTSVEARRVDFAGGEAGRVVWFDEQGRVLRVDIPSRGYRAVRQSP